MQGYNRQKKNYGFRIHYCSLLDITQLQIRLCLHVLRAHMTVLTVIINKHSWKEEKKGQHK